MPLADTCNITSQANLAIGGEGARGYLRLLSLAKNSVTVLTGEFYFTADEDGLFDFNLLRGSTAVLQGNVAGFDADDGLEVEIPDASTATLESLASAAAFPTQGATIQFDGVEQPGLVGVFNFGNGLAKSISPSGQVNLSGSPLMYIALLTQTGTATPVVSVLRNDLGGEVVFARVGVGTYRGLLVGAFPETSGLIIGQLPEFHCAAERISDDAFIVTTEGLDTTATDGVLNRVLLLCCVAPE
jgi:hypothetical protein